MSDPRITDEAVEAAAKAVSLDWQNFVASMRLALEAALPHLAPQPVVDRKALENTINEVAVATGLAKYFKSGGAEDPSDVEEFVAAVMELARPMPTREAIEQRIRRLYIDGGAHITHAQEAAKDVADAVLALLNGTAK